MVEYSRVWMMKIGKEWENNW